MNTAQTRKTTAILIAAAVIIIGGYDIYAFITGGVESTISMVMATTSYHHPVLSWCGGILTAHFFWPGRPVIDSNLRYHILVGSIILLGFAGLILTINIVPFWFAGAGVCCGRMLWAQPRQK